MWQILKSGFYFVIVLTLALSAYVYVNKVPDKSVEELAKRWAQEPSTFVEIAGMRVHVRDQGPKNDASPIILIHGTSASLHTWDGWTQVLASNRRVIRFQRY